MQRLTFVARSGTVELVSRSTVQMKPVPANHPPDALHEFWFELRDASDRALHVQAAPDPLRNEIEVFSDDPTRSASRAEDPRGERHFSVLVPELSDASQVVMMRRAAHSPAQVAAAAAAPAPAAAVEVARVKF
jgi:hypothetical protein